MNSLNLNSILKNLTAILCGLIIVALLLPFAAFSSSVSAGIVSAEAESESLSGFTFVLGGGILGILFGLMPILILAACYVPQLEAYKKYINLGCSALGILFLFLVPGQYSSSSSADYGGGTSTASISTTSTTYKFGFWVILVLFILQIALSVIQFFNLKGNKVFDAINEGNDEAGASLPKFDTEKITGFTKNVAGNIKNKASNITKSRSQTPEDPSDATATEPAAAAPATPAAAAPATQPAAAPQPAPAPAAAPAAVPSPEEIMALREKLHKMKEAGVLTEEEFAAKKAGLLEKM